MSKSWLERLKEVIGPRGYEASMRRSLQTIILYEAKRIVTPRLNALRPFQRKLAFMDQCLALVDCLDFVFPHQKQEILWRTATSKDQLKPDIAWKRVKLIDKELARLSAEIKPFLAPNRPHETAVDLLVLDIYHKSSNDTQKSIPQHWEHAHNHVIMCFRMYYNGDQLDPNFPDPCPPREIVVPTEKPKDRSVSSLPQSPPLSATPPTAGPVVVGPATANLINHSKAALAPGLVPIAPAPTTNASAALTGKAAPASVVVVPAAAAAAAAASNRHQNHHRHSTGDSAGVLGSGSAVADHAASMMIDNHLGTLNNPAEERRRVLQEVREHLDLLKEFEGSISKEDLARRKRELFLALPPAPPPCTANSLAMNMTSSHPPTPAVTTTIATSSTPAATTTANATPAAAATAPTPAKKAKVEK